MAAKTFPSVILLLAMGCTTSPAEHKTDQASAPHTVADSTANTHPEGHLANAWQALPNAPSSLVFNTGDTLHTDLHDLRMLAKVTGKGGRAWYAFSGRPDSVSTGVSSLFVLSPGDSLSQQALKDPWHMPGQLREARDKEPFYEAEVFAGEVLPDTVGVIWYDRSLMPDGTWRLNTTLLDLSSAMPDTLVLFGHDRKSATIDLAFHGKCQLLNRLVQHGDF